MLVAVWAGAGGGRRHAARPALEALRQAEGRVQVGIFDAVWRGSAVVNRHADVSNLRPVDQSEALFVDLPPIVPSMTGTWIRPGWTTRTLGPGMTGPW